MSVDKILMERRKYSPIWKISEELLRNIVINSDSFSKILKAFSLNNIGGNLVTLRARLDNSRIDYSHIKKFSSSNLGRKFPSVSKPFSEVLVKKSIYSRCFLKKRLLKEGILKNECSICGQKPWWNNKILILIIDHINGVRDDNRIENLRILCPHCNSQTSTFSGKNHKYGTKLNVCECGKIISRNSKACHGCTMLKRRKAKRPAVDILKIEIEQLGYCAVGRKYGVSDSAIRKWSKGTIV